MKRMNTLNHYLIAGVLLGACAPLGAAPPTITDVDLSLVRSAEQQRVEVIERAYPTVVMIYGNNPQAGGGSGVLFDPAGYVMTNYHVVAGAGKAGWAGLSDHKLYRWKLVGIDPGGDLAVIKLTGRDAFEYSPFGDSDGVRVGDWAMAMGNPFALAEDQTPTVTLGIVSGVKRYQGGAGGNRLVYGNCIQVDSSINPGNSGGPLFNMRGQVIGINGRGSFEERGRVNVGLGYAISANQVANFIPDLLATKLCQHATLDATFRDAPDGVICNAIDYDYSPLARHRFELGDRLIAFNGERIESANHYLNLLTTLPAGWPVEVVWLHEGKPHRAVVELNALPYRQNQNKPRIEMPRPEGPDRPGRPPRPPKVDIPEDTPGVVRDAELNEEVALLLLRRWHERHAARLGEFIEPDGVTLEGGARVGDDVAFEFTVRFDEAEGTVYLVDHLAPRLVKLEVKGDAELPMFSAAEEGAADE